MLHPNPPRSLLRPRFQPLHPESSRQLTPESACERSASVLPVGNIGEAIDRIKAIQQKTALHQALIEDHQQYSRYPAFNSAFKSEEQDPLLSDMRQMKGPRPVKVVITPSRSGPIKSTTLKETPHAFTLAFWMPKVAPVTAQLLAPGALSRAGPSRPTPKASGEAGLYTLQNTRCLLRECQETRGCTKC